MRTINSSDIVKKPGYVTKSVILPYALYEKIKEKVEDELYLMNNQKALSQKSYEEFLEIEPVSEELNETR